MFRKLILYIAVFVFTTGFLKSDLEKCANYWFDKQSLGTSFPSAEYEFISRSKEEIQLIRKKRKERTQKEINRYKSLPLCKEGLYGFELKPSCRRNQSGGKTYEEMLKRIEKVQERTDNFKRVKVRDIPEKDIQILRKKFLNKSLKKKLNLADTENIEKQASQKYNELYKFCINEKKDNLELFKAKY